MLAAILWGAIVRGSFSVKNHSRVSVRGTKVREVISWEDCPGGSYPGENCH